MKKPNKIRKYLFTLVLATDTWFLILYPLLTSSVLDRYILLICLNLNSLINDNYVRSRQEKTFLESGKGLFLNIIKKYEAILTAKQTNATSALKKKHSWENIREEFNEASIVSQKASTKQLIKLWYNMKAKARESKTKENIRHLTCGGSSVMDMNPIDAKVMDIDKNILTNIEVDIDSDVDGSVSIIRDTNNETWQRDITMQATHESKGDEKQSIDYTTPIKRSYECSIRTNKIDLLKYKILEEEWEFRKKLHDEEIKIKILERAHKEALFKLELEIKLK